MTTDKSFYEKQSHEELVEICVNYAKQIKIDHATFKLFREEMRMIKLNNNSSEKAIDKLENIISERGL